MKQLIFAIVVVISVLAIDAVAAAAQEAPPPWIPLSAKVTEHYLVDLYPEGTTKTDLTGYFLRDSHGRSYTRMRITHTAIRVPLRGQTDFGILLDAPSHVIYYIDFVKKTFRKQELNTKVGGGVPQSREEFDKSRAGEEFLGKQVISGIDCEGYRVPVPHFKKHFNETWYAPSLNFLVVKSTVYYSMKQQTETLLEDMQAGPEPEPGLFRLPSGFREVHE
jgi:hypothetical protein